MSLFSRIAAAAGSAEFAVYGDVARYLPQAGDGFDVRFVKHDLPEDAAADVGVVYFAHLELMGADLPQALEKGDQVAIDGVFYVVTKVTSPVNANVMIRLHRKVARR